MSSNKGIVIERSPIHEHGNRWVIRFEVAEKLIEGFELAAQRHGLWATKRAAQAEVELLIAATETR